MLEGVEDVRAHAIEAPPRLWACSDIAPQSPMRGGYRPGLIIIGVKKRFEPSAPSSSASAPSWPIRMTFRGRHGGQRKIVEDHRPGQRH